MGTDQVRSAEGNGQRSRRLRLLASETRRGILESRRWHAGLQHHTACLAGEIGPLDIVTQ
jgi:hypothetical protein